MNYKKPTKAIITDAGYASRYLPIAKTVPKGMLPIGNRPIMQLVVEECVAAGITEIIIVATPEGKPIYEDYFNNAVNHIRKQLVTQGKAERYDVVREVLDLPKVRVILQDPVLPYGNGSPIASARNYISNDEAFLAIYSDDVILGVGDASTLVAAFERHPDAKAIIAAQEMDRSVWHNFGMIALKDKQKHTLSHIVEKPENPEDSPSNLTSYGRYLLTPEVFDILNADNTGLDNELWTVDAITELARTGDVYVVPSKGQWLTTGDPKNYFLAHLKYVLENEDYADAVRDFVKKTCPNPKRP
jgi:UTP--glucose-1-phosphate uridylyltransferase